MTIDAIRRQTPEEFRAAVDGFDTRYVGDWDAWLAVEPALLMHPGSGQEVPCEVARPMWHSG